MSQLHVVPVQLTSGESVPANVDSVLSFLTPLPKETRVDLICLPENALFLAIGKRTPRPDIRLDDPDLRRLQTFVDQRNWPMMIGSVPIREAEGNTNATVFLEPGAEPRVLYRKIHLFDVDVPGAPPVRESDHFRHGREPALLDWRGWKIGLSICYDLRFSELYNRYARLGVDLLLVPSAFLVPTGQAHWEILLRARAIENQCFVVAAAQSGAHTNAAGEVRSTYGHSLVIGPWGEKLLELTDERRLATVVLEKAAIDKTRRQIPMRQHRADRKWEDG